MKLLHTSDWHLGRRLYDRLRTDEFDAFFAWLNALIRREHPDGIVVAGDLFDNATPSNHSVKTFTDWLAFCKEEGTKVFVVAGNHDSAAFLEAFRALGQKADAFVVGIPSKDPKADVVTLTTASGEVAVLGLVPFLSRSTLPDFEITGDAEASQREVARLMGEHYQTVRDAMRDVEAQFAQPVLRLMTGHCFVTGGTVEADDGVERALTIGTLGEVSDTIFPQDVDYVALGHLHRAQKVAGNPTHRYSGTPLPMSFSESEQAKSVVILEWSETNPNVVVTQESIPNFRRLVRLKGDESTLVEGLTALEAASHEARALAEKEGRPAPLSTWVEVHYTSATEQSAPLDLRATLERALTTQDVSILNIVDENRQRRQDVLMSDEMQLERLTPAMVFEERLKTGKAAGWSDEEKADARKKFQFILELIEAEQRGDHAPSVASDALDGFAQ